MTPYCLHHPAPKIRHWGEWRGSICGPATVSPEKHSSSKKSHGQQMCPSRARAGQKECSQCHMRPAAERLVCVDFWGLWEGEHQKPLRHPRERRSWGPLTWRQPPTWTVVILTVGSDRPHMPHMQLPSCNDWARVLRAHVPRSHALQGKPPHWEACTQQLGSSPCSPKLQKALRQQQRPSTAKNKRKTKIKKKKKGLMKDRPGQLGHRSNSRRNGQ